MNYDIKYMRRALELAARGLGHVSPNPMVGAVIVHNNHIIGEGYHRRWGDAHAEVNAINSVKPEDAGLLEDSTMYVTLEPCSHYGKTPPCAQLLINKHIPRVVVGATDPFIKVAGRGIEMMRQHGIEVEVGVLADESQRLNASFFTAHTLRSPFVTLKWAQSADGFMDCNRQPGDSPARFSTTLSTSLVHRLRSLHDAIITSAATVNSDNSMLTTRAWHGRSARPVIIDRRGLLSPTASILSRDPIIYREGTLPQILSDLYTTHGLTSVMVEAGPTLLNSFIANDLWDVARVEISPLRLEGNGTAPAPKLAAFPIKSFSVDINRVELYSQNPLVTERTEDCMTGTYLM